MFDFFTTVSVEYARNLSPVTLAFVGDAVYSLYVRERLVLSTDFKTGELQKLTSKEVSAHGQSILLEKLMPLFTEEENEIFRRGRNAKKATRSKNASVAEYNRSTGFEAVLGYLYLTGQYKRIDELLDTVHEN
ncbi:MAG: ribonuclease III [Clostridia bacterium]|nr:ribonuclease III [Clostridia bacterium]